MIGTRWIVLIWLTVLACSSATAQNLPIEVQTDLLLVRIERAIANEEHEETLSLISELRQMDPAADVVELSFFEAVAAQETDDLDRAEKALTRFVTMGGRESEIYPRALEMIIDLPHARAELAEAQRQERIRQEQERRRQEAAAKRAEEQRLLAAERALNLSERDMLRIRFVLHQRFGRRWEPPSRTATMTSQERGWLERYARETGRSGLRHLNRQVANELLAEDFSPARTSYSAGSFAQLRQFGSWYSYRTSSNRCAIAAPAGSFNPDVLYVHPKIVFDHDPSWGRDSLSFDMVSPNPFSGGRITAWVDGEEFAVQIDNGHIKPAASGSGVDDAVMRAMRNGRTLRIEGGSRLSSHRISISFPLAGFAQAFQHMADQCQRPTLTSTWLGGPVTTVAAGAQGQAEGGVVQLDPEHCLIVVASRRTISEVRSFIDGLAADMRGGVRVFVSSNGWNAIGIGAVPRERAQASIQAEAAQRRIPSDSYCTKGEQFSREVPRRDFTAAPSGFAGTHRVFSQQTGYANLRFGPGNDQRILVRLPNGTELAVQSINERGWARVRGADGYEGWAYSGLLQRK